MLASVVAPMIAWETTCGLPRCSTAHGFARQATILSQGRKNPAFSLHAGHPDNPHRPDARPQRAVRMNGKFEGWMKGFDFLSIPNFVHCLNLKGCCGCFLANE